MSRALDRNTDSQQRHLDKLVPFQAVNIRLNPDHQVQPDEAELAICKQQLKGYSSLIPHAEAHLQFVYGMRNQLGLTDYQQRLAIIPYPTPEQQRERAELFASMSRRDKELFNRLESPAYRAVTRVPRYTDDFIDDLVTWFNEGSITLLDLHRLKLTYGREMSALMREYVQILEPVPVKKKGPKKNKKQPLQNNVVGQKAPIEQVEEQFELTPSEPTEAQTLQPFSLSDRDLALTQTLWSTNPRDLVPLDTSSKTSFIAQLTRLVGRDIVSRPSALVKKLEFFLQPASVARLLRSGLRYTPKGVDKGWLRVRTGDDRIGIFPLDISENNLIRQAILCVGYRNWVYDRVTDR